MNPALCSILPYSDRSLWGIGRRLHEAGYVRRSSSYGMAWGFGHPRFLLERDGLDRLVTTCTRCGKKRVIA